MDKKLKAILWITWGILTPVLLTITYKIWPPSISGYELDIVSFLLLMCLVTFWPIIVNDTPVFFSQGVSLAVFLYYGVFVEIVLTQITVIVLLIKIRVSWKDTFRFPTNSLMFLIVSLVSALVYYALGGTHGEINFSFAFLAAVIAYEFSMCLTNHFVLRFIRKVFYQQRDKFVTKDFLWEVFTSILVFPIGVVLYFLYKELGLSAIFYVGIPFVGISIILTLYHSSQRVNSYLQQASEIGQQLTERLNVDDVLDIFMEKMTSMIKVDYAYIVDVIDKENLKIVRKYENGKIIDNPNETKSIREGISGYVYSHRKGVLYRTRDQRRDIINSQLPPKVESVMAVPVMRNQQVVGIVILASNKKRAYENYQLMIVDLLTAYLGVASDNAKNYEKTKKQSERCALTGLFNYRYLETVLDNEFKRLQSKKLTSLSLILLEIDHFKNVNDTYGHQSGNEILIGIAKRLLKIVGDKGIVARYGGEEFVVLLPNYEKKSCYAFAEGIRQAIAGRPFVLEQAIVNSTNIKQYVPITASIGYATAPHDADDALALIRHADRAMYTGAKQAGRNRVAEYVK
ncbi:diguanylate cyclase [Metabacillus herbersteinensis]|uniref:Diguanylate cyclase n=1 Tax=Metabacillus herbersteinensis TaxID=283816 RepID=A0ABV6G9N6_9BACI